MTGRPRTVSFGTLGCKLNQFETFDLQRQFEERGYRVVPFPGPADICVVNTCTVTAKSDYRCRQALRRARRANPGGYVIATGCYAQTRPGSLAGMPEVDLVLGNREKGSVFSWLPSNGAVRPGTVHVGSFEGAPGKIPEITGFGGHTRAFVKIQDGCDSRCSYCIVPLARGPNTSYPAAAVARQIARLIAAGHREIVLTGVHLGTWGRDISPVETLASLLERIERLPGLERLRLSSIEPTEFSDELIGVIAGSPRICPHLHLPLQSGSDRILRAMRRPYTAREYEELVLLLAEAIPDLGLGADVIAGFPGETAEDFNATRDLLERLPVSYLHVFPYSRRPGTEAAGLSGEVPVPERESRAAALRALGKARAVAYRRCRVGRTYRALIEGPARKDSGLRHGLTGNYLKILVPAPEEMVNTFREITLTRCEGLEIYGAVER